jgi:serine/threonine-protein kinase
MAQLSSHPLPASALRAVALQRSYASTPAAPAAGVPAQPTPTPPPLSERRTRPSSIAAPSGPRPRFLSERYELIEYLDSGGTAEIFVALDCETGRRVAVKILNDAAHADPLLRGYFLGGARAALRIRHPNVVCAEAVLERAEGAPFAVMEVIAGKPLSSMLANHGSLPPLMVAELGIQAAAGLDAAHRAGVVHCDVKPENLLIAPRPCGRLQLKVIDFDLAALDPEEEPHEHPMLRGTAKYMSPEQVVGDRVDARTDVYSLGMVLFRMLTGHLPFELELSATLLWHQLVSRPPPPSWLCEAVDARLEAIVLKALCKAPQNRYATMSLMLADLHAWHAGQPLLAERPLMQPDVFVARRETARAAARAIVHCVQRGAAAR